MNMWIVCLGLLAAVDAASLGRRPLDIPVEVVYDYAGKSLQEREATENGIKDNTHTLRNHDAKLQLSPEEVVEAAILNIPTHVAEFNNEQLKTTDPEVAIINDGKLNKELETVLAQEVKEQEEVQKEIKEHLERPDLPAEIQQEVQALLQEEQKESEKIAETVVNLELSEEKEAINKIKQLPAEEEEKSSEESNESDDSSEEDSNEDNKVQKKQSSTEEENKKPSTEEKKQEEQPTQQKTEQPTQQETEQPTQQETEQPTQQETEQPAKQETEQLTKQEATETLQLTDRAKVEQDVPVNNEPVQEEKVQETPVSLAQENQAFQSDEQPKASEQPEEKPARDDPQNNKVNTEQLHAEKVEPEIKFEEIEKPAISSDSHVLDHVDKPVEVNVEQEHVNEKQESKTIDVPLDADKLELADRSKAPIVDNVDAALKVDYVKEGPQSEPIQEELQALNPAPEVQKVETPTVPAQQTDSNVLDTVVEEKETVNVQPQQDAPESKPEEKKDEPIKEENSKARQMEVENKPAEDAAQPATLNQAAPEKKPEDETAASSTSAPNSWIAGLAQNMNNQLSSFNNTFNEFVDNLRPAKPSESNQNDEQPAPSSPFLDRVQSTFNNGFQSFQDNMNNLVNNNLLNNQQTQTQSDESGTGTSSNFIQTSFQNAASNFNQAVSSMINNFQGSGSQQTQSDEASNQSNNIPGQLLNFFQTGMNNIAQVFNPNQGNPQSDEATQGSNNPFQAFQNIVSGVGQQFNNFVGGGQAQSQDKPAVSIPTQITQTGQNVVSNLQSIPSSLPQNAESPLQTLQQGVSNVAGSIPQESPIQQIQAGVSNAINPTEPAQS